MRKERRIDGWALEKIVELHRKRPTWKAADILRELEGDPERGNHLLPTDRTIRDIITDLDEGDVTAPWNISPDGDPARDRAVMETLHAAIFYSGKEMPAISDAEARWIAYLAVAVPSLPPYLRFVAVWHIKAQRAAGRTLEGLTAFLAYEPWLDLDHWDIYQLTLKADLVPPAPDTLLEHARKPLRFKQLGPNLRLSFDPANREKEVALMVEQDRVVGAMIEREQKGDNDGTEGESQ